MISPEAKHICDMIENVSPDDSFAFFDLDVSVSKWLDPEKLISVVIDVRDSIPKYSTSRDALKAIRPEGWEIYIKETAKCFYCSLSSSNKVVKTLYGSLTEELAELWAIITAIDYERKPNDK